MAAVWTCCKTVPASSSMARPLSRLSESWGRRRRCATPRPHDSDSLARGRAIEELAGTVLQHVQTAAMAVDDDGRVGVYNPAAARALGVEVDSVVGRDLESLATAPPALAALAAILLEARRSGRAAARR